MNISLASDGCHRFIHLVFLFKKFAKVRCYFPWRLSLDFSWETIFSHCPNSLFSLFFHRWNFISYLRLSIIFVFSSIFYWFFFIFSMFSLIFLLYFRLRIFSFLLNYFSCLLIISKYYSLQMASILYAYANRSSLCSNYWISSSNCPLILVCLYFASSSLQVVPLYESSSES